ncbi:MAG: ribosome assembly cofactor RimP [Rikenellaceae bacterium]
MIDCNKIIASAEEKLAGTDMFVVGCTCSGSNEVELTIDSDTHVSIDTCIMISKAIEGEFDREVEDFSLTVASAGIGSELKLLRQYQKLVGGSVEVLLFSGIKITAKLIEANDEGIKVEYTQRQSVETPSGKKKKQDVTIEECYTFEQIKSTCEYIDFK